MIRTVMGLMTYTDGILFICKTGNVQYENYEFVRLIRHEKPLYENADTTKFSAAELVKYHGYLKMNAELDSEIKDIKAHIDDYSRGYEVYRYFDWQI